MKHSIKMLVAGLLCCSAMKAGAAFTNMVQNINLNLTVYTQGNTVTNGSIISEPVVKFKKTTKDVIELLGTATTNTFSPSAKLIFVSPLPEGDATIYVQDGTNKVDVTGFFSEDESGSLSAYSTNTVSHIERETSYSILRLRLHDRDTDKIALHFDLRGFGTVTSASIVKNAAILGKSHVISAKLAGTGEWDDGLTVSDLLLQCTLSITGNTLVVTP